MRDNKKAFTLAELLIVVAIIGVLAVIAIPIFSTQLEKSRENTDIANLRVAKGAAMSMYLDKGSSVAGEYYFDTGAGILYTSKDGIMPYGRGTAKKGGCHHFMMSTTDAYTETVDCEGKIIKATIAFHDNLSMDNTDVVLSWVDPET